MPLTRADRRGGTAEGDGPDRGRHLVIADRLRVGVSEVPQGAEAPAAHAAAVEHGTRVLKARADRFDGTADVDGPGAHRLLVVPDAVRVGVAEPAVAGEAPAA